LGFNDTATVQCADQFTVLSNQQINAITPSVEKTGTRINTVLNYTEINYQGARSIDTGSSTLGAFAIDQDTNCLNYLQQINTSEQGYLFMSANGTLTFKGRSSVLNPVSGATFNGDGTKAFGALTNRVTSLQSPLNQVAIVLDGLVVSAPRINEAIPSGNAQITGSFSQVEAQDLANVLKYGALPLAFDRGEVQQVSPTLGADQLNAGLLAGALGLGLVLLYSLLYYRGLGLVVVGSLGIAAIIVYLLFLVLGETIGFTLTLAGIAGAITAIGVTADSFIVYFERIRDEVREGRSIRSAVESGWAKARHTILVADAVSLIAAALLYFFAVGGVRGFAFTLGLTTLVDLIIVFFFTKPMVTILAGLKFFSSGHRFSGLSPRSIGMKNYRTASTSTDSTNSVSTKTDSTLEA
jgi:preprotein translocase subunit SecD